MSRQQEYYQDALYENSQMVMEQFKLAHYQQRMAHKFPQDCAKMLRVFNIAGTSRALARVQRVAAGSR
jgi:hypothetical protein